MLDELWHASLQDGHSPYTLISLSVTSFDRMMFLALKSVDNHESNFTKRMVECKERGWLVALTGLIKNNDGTFKSTLDFLQDTRNHFLHGEFEKLDFDLLWNSPGVPIQFAWCIGQLAGDIRWDQIHVGIRNP